MDYTDFTKKELISKIQELKKEISKVKLEQASMDTAHLSKKENAVFNLLKESELKHIEAQEIAHIGHWNLDLINNKLEWSAEIYKIFGLDPSKVSATYENFLNAIHPDDREFVNRSYTESLENKTKYDITHRIVLPNEEIQFVREQCRTTYDKSGHPLHSLGTVQDITELYLAEEKFKLLFENLGDAVYVTRIGGKNKGQILEVNSAAILQSGYTREELLNLNIIRDIQISGTGNLSTAEWEEKLIKGETVTATEMKRRKDGSAFWTEVIVTSIDFKGEKTSLSINRDITERKSAEERIKKENERTKTLLELRSSASQMLDKELYDFVLDKAIALTSSKVGFFHQVHNDQNIISLTTWNKEALKKCNASYNAHYPITEAGNWVDCVHQKQAVIYNDFSKSPNQKGLPDGHFPLNRFMSIPVMDEDIVHYIFGVGNKETDYEDHDMHQIQLIANELNKIIKQRQADEEIRKLNEELEERVIERTKELSQEKIFSDMVINSLPGMFFVVDKDLKLIRWNKTHEKVTGYSPEEYKSMMATDFFDDDEKNRIEKRMTEVFTNGSVDMETHIRTKAGMKTPYFIVGSRVIIDDAPYIIGMGIDISERKHAEEELRVKTNELETFNKVMIEREMRIIEMKEDVNKLSKELGLKLPYPPVWEEGIHTDEKHKN